MPVLLLSAGISCKNDNATANGSGGQSTAAASDTKALETSGIAFVRADSVMLSYDMYHDMKAEFEQKAKKMEAEFSSKARTFQNEYADFQEKYQKGLMTRSEAEEKGQKLQRRQEDLESTGAKMRQDLAEEEAVMMRKINDAVMKYIEKYNEEKKFSLILNNATVLYGNPSMDITQDILIGLNKEYTASKATQPATTTTKK